MEIRLEKVEIKIPEDLVDTIISGALKLKSLEVQLRSSGEGARASIMAAIATAVINKLDTFLETMKTAAAKSAPETDEEPGAAPVGHGG